MSLVRNFSLSPLSGRAMVDIHLYENLSQLPSENVNKYYAMPA